MKVCSQCAVHYPDAVEFCPRDGSRLPPPPGDTQALYDPLLGQTLDGRYIIEAMLGEGGMGVVYSARHAIIDKRVAIKVLRKEAATDESAAQRFIVEAKAASKIGHQNIVDITDFGVLPAGNAYFVMEHIAGPTLGRLLHDYRTLPPERAVAVAIQTARGLQAAHQKSIIHRDLKPENIFVLERDGQQDFVKIVDFGIAKDVKAGKRLTAVGMVLGTPEYMSPEQATGQETDHRVDQYALGCILYEMVTGDVPFKGENAPKTLTKHVFDPLVPPSQARPDLAIPPVIEKIIVRMLAKKPGERFADMREVILALEAAADTMRGAVAGAVPSELSARTSAPYSEMLLETPARSRAPLYVMGTVAAALALAAGGWAMTRRNLAKTRGAATVTDAPTHAAYEPGANGGATDNPATAAGTHASAPGTVGLQVSTQPPGAEVLLDGEKLGTAPVDVRRPTALAAVITVRHPGYREVTRSLVLDRDQTLDLVLQPKPHGGAPTGKLPPLTATPTKPHPNQPPPQAPRHSSDLRNPFE